MCTVRLDKVAQGISSSLGERPTVFLGQLVQAIEYVAIEPERDHNRG